MQTQVAIVGGGPAGLLLSEILHGRGVESVVLERSSREHVLSRIRAGVLEQTTVDVLRANGLGERLDREGRTHNEVENVQLFDLTSSRPCVTFTRQGVSTRLACDFVAGCDGFHGVSRQTIPPNALRQFEKIYPFGWLGLLSPTPPLTDITYANHPRGFALASARSPTLRRYYIQVPLNTHVDEWPDERFWPELKARFPRELADEIVAGPSLEKSIAALRSYVAEPMQYGRLFLAGDAAHIVPPTGAKGLNLAVSDVACLAQAIATFHTKGSSALLERYSETALRRVWSSVRVSWYLTTLLHRFPEASDFDQRAQEYELEYLRSSHHAQIALAEQYAGLPIDE